MCIIFKKNIHWNKLSSLKKKKILLRPSYISNRIIKNYVKKILHDIYLKGDKSIYAFTKKFDKVNLDDLLVSEKTIHNSFLKTKKNIKKAILTAARNIEFFHSLQKIPLLKVHTQLGIKCQQIVKPINSVGLYIPGGTAPLLSTVLMLSIPAFLSQCSNIVLCSPPPISNEILYAAFYICGIKKIFQIGGIQAIGAMAFGTNTIPKVDKIFGPGNIYVTEAKNIVNKSYNYTDIDMLAGPSELIVIADCFANPNFIAADLLSQAEHGIDSQVFLLTNSIKLANSVKLSINEQIASLSRINIIYKSLRNSKIIITKSIKECIHISNLYAPEHLILQCKKAKQWLNYITNAGSIFIGKWSPESVGDYASGTNHVLPTYGKVKTFSGISLMDFQKKITVQELTKQGLRDISSTIKILSDFERLDAHYNAVSVRLKLIKEL